MMVVTERKGSRKLFPELHGFVLYNELVYLYLKNIIVLGSIADEVIGLFNVPNPSSRIMALGSTQPLTKMNSRNLPGRGRG
jgi:hypothetical protein